MKKLFLALNLFLYACGGNPGGGIIGSDLPVIEWKVLNNATFDESGGIPWWNTSWGKRRKITFDMSTISEDLTNFPILIKLSNTLIDYSKLQTNGEDIRFYDTVSKSILAHEIESWNEKGVSAIWVKIPLLKALSTTDHIWIYYENNNATDGQSISQVWSNGFVGVWHLNDDPTLAPPLAIDSTSFENRGNISGPMSITSSRSGISGKAISFDGIDDKIEIPNSTSMEISGDKLTVSAWGYYPTDGTVVNDYAFICKGPTTNNERYMLGTDSGVSYNFRTSTDSGYRRIDAGALLKGEWVYSSGIYDGSNMKLYANAVEVYSLAQTGNIAADSSPAYIGKRCLGDERYFRGIIDEVRLANVARSENWLKAQYLASRGMLISTFSSEKTQDSLYKFALVIDRETLKDVVVNFSLYSSKNGNDLIIRDSLTISAGSTLEFFSFLFDDNNNYEIDDTFTLVIDDIQNATSNGNNTFSFVIPDDDGPQLQFDVSQKSVIESVNSVTINVELNSSIDSDLNVPLVLTGDASGSGIDYTISNQSILIPAGQITASTTIDIVDDSIDEINEVIVVAVDDTFVSNITIGQKSHMVISIIDNDGPTIDFSTNSQTIDEFTGSTTITINASETSVQEIKVPFTLSGTASKSSDYSYDAPFDYVVIPIGETSALVTVTIVDDLIDEYEETAIFTMGTPDYASPGTVTNHTITITDDDIPPGIYISAAYATEGNDLVFTVSLDSASGKNITFDWDTSDISAISPGDYVATSEMATITAGSLSTTLAVTTNTDAEVEDNESLAVTLSNLSNATIIDDTGIGYIVIPSPPIVSKTIGNAGADFLSIQSWVNTRQGNLPVREILNVTGGPGTFTSGELITAPGGCSGTYVSEDEIATNGSVMTLDSFTGVCVPGETLSGATATATYNSMQSINGNIEKAVILNDRVYDEIVLIDGSTTCESHYMWLTVNDIDRHNGIAGAGVVVDPGTLGHVFDIRDDYFVLEGVEITGWPNEVGSNSWEGVHVEANHVLLDKLLIHDDDSSGYSNPNSDAIQLQGMSEGDTVTIQNCIIYNIGRGAINYQDYNTVTVNIDNTTIYNTGVSGSNADGEGGINSRSSTATINIRNTISIGSGSGADFKLELIGNSSNNISSDSSAPGADSQFGQIALDHFVSITPLSENLHLIPTSTAIVSGVDLSSVIDVDVEGDLRPNNVFYDIGADEFY